MKVAFAEKLKAILPSKGKSAIVTLPASSISPEGGVELFSLN